MNLHFELYEFRKIAERISDPNTKAVAEFVVKLGEHLEGVEKEAKKAMEEAQRAKRDARH